MAEYSIIHSSIDGHLGCFHIMAIVNNAVNIECVYLFELVVVVFFFFFSLKYPGMELLFSTVQSLSHV